MPSWPSKACDCARGRHRWAEPSRHYFDEARFWLYEKDKPREVDYFSTEQAPIPIALLLDTSKYSSDKVDAERVARHQKLLLRTRLAPLPAERNLADREKGI